MTAEPTLLDPNGGSAPLAIAAQGSFAVGGTGSASRRGASTLATR